MSMTWESKLAETVEAVKDNLKLGMVFDTAEPANSEFLANLKASHPYLDDDYVRFLSISDGAQIWWYVLAGSGQSSLTSLETLEARWKPSIEQFGVFPIGEDPAGACVAITQDGRVVQFDYRAETESDLVELAPSFDAFLDEVLMGERYYSLFDVPPSEIEDNHWLEFMKQKEWISSL